jgi:hypothetical protein
LEERGAPGTRAEGQPGDQAARCEEREQRPHRAGAARFFGEGDHRHVHGPENGPHTDEGYYEDP